MGNPPCLFCFLILESLPQNLNSRAKDLFKISLFEIRLDTGDTVNKRFIHSHAGDEAKEVDFLLYAAGFLTVCKDYG